MATKKNKGREKRMLSSFVDALGAPNVTNLTDSEVAGIKSDSRAVERGDVFVAVRGTGVDGHRFVDEAERRGAIACVTEQPVELQRAANIVVENSARALAVLASRFYGDPSQRLVMIGGTGTNGKTSTTHLFRAIAEKSGWGKMGLIGTVGHGIGDNLEANVHTTPEPVTLHRLLAEMEQQGCSGVVMEVSSHAVRQQRTWGIDFNVGMLTNITRDHLDYHSSLDDYIDAKREFCYSLVSSDREKPDGILVYSLDNDNSERIGEEFSGKKIATSTLRKTDVYADDIDATLDGTRFDLHIGGAAHTTVHMKLLGIFSVSNALTAAAAAHAMGIEVKGIKAGLEDVEHVPGRFEALGGDSRPHVIVDYSHTPDSLERTLEFCAALKPDRLIAVFGCGGDRDRGKRPIMGRIAQRLSDICYVTSDNPRTEDPNAIIDEILTGMDTEKAGLVVEVDRRKAIRAAVAGAGPADVVAICGKGHEDYQIIGTTRHHLDDREEAEEALMSWGKK